MGPTRSILDAKYQKSNLSKIVSDSKYLSHYKTIILYNVLTKYEFPFNETLGTR